MQPKIVTLSEKKLVGKSRTMSLVDNTTKELWQSFMPYKKRITNPTGSDLYAIQVYESHLYFKQFNPQTVFTKWAAIEVKDFDHIPDHLEIYVLKGGLYAVFTHKGLPSEFQKTFNLIFNDWLPKSDYELDHRAHFELLGEKYSATDPNSEEEIWIPIKLKK